MTLKRLIYLMKIGYLLNLWRCSSPHNWYLEHPKTHKQIHLDTTDALQLRKLCQIVWISNNRIIKYWGSDSQMPEKETYALKRLSLLDKSSKSIRLDRSRSLGK